MKVAIVTSGWVKIRVAESEVKYPTPTPTFPNF